jgi:hypothetical protein
MVDGARGYLIRQFETAWKLTTFHLDVTVDFDYAQNYANPALNRGVS